MPEPSVHRKDAEAAGKYVNHLLFGKRPKNPLLTEEERVELAYRITLWAGYWGNKALRWEATHGPE